MKKYQLIGEIADFDYHSDLWDFCGPKSLKMPDSLTTDYFTYRVTGSRFTATLNRDIKDCPAGSRWTVSASTKGFFSVDLVLYRAAPKDTNCTVIAPDFKNLGRR